MITTGKSVRVARTNLGTALPQSVIPTERTALVAHDLPEPRATKADSLNALNAAIDRFTASAIGGLSAVQEGYQRGKLEEIRLDNEAQQRQAMGDALVGRDMDAALVDDNDYYSAFRSVRAQRDGFDAAQEFTSWYQQDWLPANPVGDLQAARDQWAKDNLTGADDADYEGQLLASFLDKTDVLLPEHMRSVLKHQTDAGVQALGALIDADVVSGGMTAARLVQHIESARILDPLNATEAPARVVTALLASANNHPSKIMAVSNLLSQPGTGVNEKSFAESFPDAYSAFQSSAVESYNSINTERELSAYTALTDRVRSAKTPEDLVSLTVDALKFREEFGAPAKVGALLYDIETALGAQAEIADGINAVFAWMNGDRTSDPADVRKFWTPMLEQMGLRSILDAEPAAGAALLHNLGGVVPDEAQAQLSASLLDVRNPAAQGKALQLLTALAQTSGKETAEAFLNGPSRQLFQQAYGLMALTDAPLDEVLARVNESRSGIKSWDAGWKIITGAETDPKGRDAALKVVQAKLREHLGRTSLFGSSDVHMPATLTDSVLEIARTKAIEAEANGRGWEAAVVDAIGEIASRSEVVPTRRGLVLVTGADRAASYLNADGATTTRPRLGTAVADPLTGKPVDTVRVFERQRDDLVNGNRWVLPGGDPSRFGLAPALRPELRARGMFAATDADGNEIRFYPGDEVIPGAQRDEANQWNGLPIGLKVFDPDTAEKVALPDTEDGMSALFDFGDDGFGFVPIDTGDGIAWVLGYRPNFGNEASTSVDQKAVEFAPPAPPPISFGFGPAMVQFDPAVLIGN